MNNFELTIHKKNHQTAPVWFMRQAGRVLPSYNKLKETYSFRQMMHDPKLAAQVTLSPVHELGVDAAILFSDILVIPEALGMKLEFTEQGPVFSKPLYQIDAPHKHLTENTSELNYIYETIRTIKAIEPQTPLIGFCGAPLTTLLYMLQGFSRKQEFPEAINFILSKPTDTRLLVNKITEISIEYASKQADAGIQCFQLFDTHAGLIPFDMYKEFFMPANRLILNAVRRKGIPTIYFPKGIGAGIAHVSPEDTDFLSIDWQTSIYDARQLVHPVIGIQGNIDPRLLLCDKKTIEIGLQYYFDFYRENPQWIVNLGHGVLANTPFENAKFVVDYIKQNFIWHANS